jgi:hypothetical protein
MNDRASGLLDLLDGNFVGRYSLDGKVGRIGYDMTQAHKSLRALYVADAATKNIIRADTANGPSVPHC